MKSSSTYRFIIIISIIIIAIAIVVTCIESNNNENEEHKKVREEIKEAFEKKHEEIQNEIEKVKNQTAHHKKLHNKSVDSHSKSSTSQVNNVTIIDQEIVKEEEEQEQEEVEVSNNLLLIVGTIFASIMLTYLFLNFEFRYLPESIATIFVGGILGAVLFVYGKHVEDVFRLDSSFFFLFLLPPIIFDSGYTLSKRHFLSNFGSIMIFSVFGTLISSLVIGVGLGLSGVLPWIDSLVFGAILSAIDPVATLAIFQSVQVESTLSTLVFGESVLNDAISIVLYKTFYQFLKDGFSMTAVLEAFTHFTMIFFGSIAIGALLALFTALIFKYMNFRRFPSLEISLIFICCYVPYLIGEGLSLSGILAILGNAIVNSHYTHYNLTEPTQMAVKQSLHAMSHLSETIVFAYLGLAVFSYTHRINVILILVAIVCCIYIIYDLLTLIHLLDTLLTRKSSKCISIKFHL
jgi:sodium/hydrogen exchanger 8